MEPKQRLALRIGVLVIGVGAAFAIRAARTPSTEGLPGLDGVGDVVPAALGGEGALALEVSATTDARGERLRLARGDATVELLLLDAAPLGEGLDAVRFGRALLSTPSAAAGGAFVGVVAGWLGPAVGVPPARAGVLEAYPLSFAYLGAETRSDGRRWEARKLFFEDAGRYAELYLNVTDDRHAAELLEKDEEYRADLVALLALAVRDGRPGRRTSTDDPALETTEPLVGALAPLQSAGAEVGGLVGIALGSGYLAAVDGEPARILHWTEPARPPRTLCALDGRGHAFFGKPDAGDLALVLIHPKETLGLSSNDPGEVVIVRPVDGTCRALPVDPTRGRIGTMSTVVFSPDGRALALDVLAGAKPPHSTSTIVHEVSSGRVLGATDPALDAEPETWTPAGLELVHHRFEDGGAMHLDRYLWHPGVDAPRALAPDAGSTAVTSYSWKSPDGLYVVRAEADGRALIVGSTGPAEERRFERARPDDMAALRLLAEGVEPTWLGAHALVLASDDPIVLDLATLRLRYLLPASTRATLRHASPDGRRVWLTLADGAYVWGDTTAPR